MPDTENKDRWITEGKLRMAGHIASLAAIPMILWVLNAQVITGTNVAELTERFNTVDARSNALSERISNLQANDLRIDNKVDRIEDRLRGTEIDISKLIKPKDR